jgi:hypothetical protein
MSEPTLDELRAVLEHDEATCHALEQALDRLDPNGAPYARRLGVELPDHSHYSDDVLGRKQYAVDLVGRRRLYLESRYVELSEQAARRSERESARAAGLDRFLEAGARLDDLTAPAAESIAAAGGLTAEHLAELGRERGTALPARPSRLRGAAQGVPPSVDAPDA